MAVNKLEDAIDGVAFRVGADVVGQIERLFYNVRKIAQIVADATEVALTDL